VLLGKTMQVPRYSEIRPQWRDELGREYMQYGSMLAVRIPRRRREHQLSVPQPGTTLLLTEVGGGKVRALSLLAIAMPPRRRATALFEYREL
jgi:hypothetical protein